MSPKFTEAAEVLALAVLKSAADKAAQPEAVTVKQNLPASQDLKSILEHVRGQFQYHAGQRLNTIRFFFLAYGIFAVAYGSALKPPLEDYALPTAMGFSAVVVTLAFWAFDYRNERLVRVGEKGIEELECHIAEKYTLKHFKMVKVWDNPPNTWIPGIKYRRITPALYAYFLALAIAATYLAGQHVDFKMIGAKPAVNAIIQPDKSQK